MKRLRRNKPHTFYFAGRKLKWREIDLGEPDGCWNCRQSDCPFKASSMSNLCGTDNTVTGASVDFRDNRLPRKAPLFYRRIQKRLIYLWRSFTTKYYWG